MCALGNFGARFARAVFQILRSQINPPSTDPKLDTLCRKNLLRTQNRWSQKPVTNPISLRTCNFSRPTNWSVTGLKNHDFRALRRLSPQLLPAPRYGSTTASGKIREKCVTFKMSPIFFRAIAFFKIGGAWKQTFAIFSDFAGSRKM